MLNMRHIGYAELLNVPVYWKLSNIAYMEYGQHSQHSMYWTWSMIQYSTRSAINIANFQYGYILIPIVVYMEHFKDRL